MCCVQNNLEDNLNVKIEIDQNGLPLYDQMISHYKEKILAIRLVKQLNARTITLINQEDSTYQNDDIILNCIIEYNTFVNTLKNNPNDTCINVINFRRKIVSLVKKDYQYYKNNSQSIFGGRKMDKIYRVYQIEFAGSKLIDIAETVGLDLFYFFTSSLQYIYPFHLSNVDNSNQEQRSINEEIFNNYLDSISGQIKEHALVDGNEQKLLNDLVNRKIKENELINYLVDSMKYGCMIPDWIRSPVRKIRLLNELKELNNSKIIEDKIIDQIINRKGGPFPNGDISYWGLSQDDIRQLNKVFYNYIVPNDSNVLSIEVALDKGKSIKTEYIEDKKGEKESSVDSSQRALYPDDDIVIRKLIEKFFNEISNDSRYDNLKSFVKNLQRNPKPWYEINPKAFFYLLLCEVTIKLLDDTAPSKASFKTCLNAIDKRKPNGKDCIKLLKDILLSLALKESKEEDIKELISTIQDIVLGYIQNNIIS